MFSCEFCEIVNNIFFKENLRVTTLVAMYAECRKYEVVLQFHICGLSAISICPLHWFLKELLTNIETLG